MRSFILALTLCNLPHVALAEDNLSYRQPVAIQLSKDQLTLVVANQKSGSLSLVDTKTKKVSEFPIGKSLRDLHLLPNGNWLTVDFAEHLLIEFKIEKQKPIIIAKTIVAKYPQCVTANSKGDVIYVSSLWSRRVSVLQRTAEKSFRPLKTIDLDFAPREIVLLDSDSRLLVADNFDGRLAVVNCATFVVDVTHQITGHNIRGLGIANDGKTLLVSHQMLNELAHTSRNDIHWGLLMSNDLRWIDVNAILKPNSELYKSAHMHPLGKENDAAGDPGRLAVGKDGLVITTISGINEIAFGKEEDFGLKRIKVGRHPVDVEIDFASQIAYVANSFDDSISVFDISKQKIAETISLGPIRSHTKAERGEQLFFDASLSHDGWLSCHSCHTDGHSNGGLNDNFTDRSFGAPKQVLTLLGRKNTEPLAWNGEVKTFETQIKNSIESTMQSKDSAAEDVIAALSVFVKQLPAPPSLAVARDQFDSKKFAAGKKVFESFGCTSCHQGPTYTSSKTFDVGLKDEKGNSNFNPPSLLGVSQRSPYFHDGRAKSINEILHKFKHQIPAEATANELQKLKEFLLAL